MRLDSCEQWRQKLFRLYSCHRAEHQRWFDHTPKAKGLKVVLSIAGREAKRGIPGLDVMRHTHGAVFLKSTFFPFGFFSFFSLFFFKNVSACMRVRPHQHASNFSPIWKDDILVCPGEINDTSTQRRGNQSRSIKD